MELERLQKHWTALGEQDPLWAILTFPDKQGGRWNLEEFFATGRADAADVLRELADRGIVIERGRALDFGCGVGRVTRALAEHFDSCDGVDVASSMIERARELNKDVEGVRFHHNAAPDLRLFGDESFDFIFSLIVLQHMEPQLMRGYLREFVRVLRPGGVACFNVPERLGVVDEPLPAEAWRASLALIGTIPRLAPRRTVPVTIRVRNDSPVPWPASAHLRVGDHWRGADGGIVVLDDARTAIEPGLDPSSECEVELNVRAPAEPGDYELEVDLVQEMIGWFADRGSRTLKLPVTVSGEPETLVTKGAAAAQPSTKPGGPSEFTPRMEMHAMAPEDVVATLEDAGGVVLDMIAKDRCGPAVPSLDYIVARAPRRSRGERDSRQGVIEARIRQALEDRGHASRAWAKHLVAMDPQRPERIRRALRLLDDRADLVGFGLTSTLTGFGRASTAVRGAARRVLFQVLHRQTEHNQLSDELIRSHETQLEGIGTTVRAQLDLQAEAEERLDALERRLARIEGQVGRPGVPSGLETGEPARD